MRCAGAPLATAGAKPRVDSDGQAACEQCGLRLSRCKATHKHGVGHACHPRCPPERLRKQQQAAGLAPPLPAVAGRSHKKDRSGNTAPATPHELHGPQQHSPPFYRTRDGAISASARSGRACANGWLELAADDELRSGWRRLSCGCDELDTAQALRCSFLEEKRVRLRHCAARIAREVLTSHGVVATEGLLRMGAVRLLRIPKGVPSPPPPATNSTTVVLRLNPDEPERFLLLVQFRLSRERF